MCGLRTNGEPVRIFKRSFADAVPCAASVRGALHRHILLRLTRYECCAGVPFVAPFFYHEFQRFDAAPFGPKANLLGGGDVTGVERHRF